MKKNEIIKHTSIILIILYLFLLSIKLMGSSFKLFGADFAEQLISITTNPFVGLFIGILATSIIQSSSATSSIVVGLTASGALSIGNAIPIIMGANIGTSITSMLVSLGHITRRKEFVKAFEAATVHDLFNFIVILVFLPLELSFHILEHTASYLTRFFLGSDMGITFSSPLKLVIDPVASPIKSFFSDTPIFLLILSLAMLFLSLKYFVNTMRPLAESEFKHMLNYHIFRVPLRSFSFGLGLTAMVQSSSVTTSMLVPMVGSGMVSTRKVFPYIIGANIGTTVTALMASLVAGAPAGVTVALVHILLNTFGSIMIYPIRGIPLNLAKYLGELSFKSRIYPLLYILLVFFVIPSVFIYICS